MTKIKTFVNIGFILNVTTLIIQATDIFKPVMNPGTAQNVATRFFLLTHYHVIKTFQLAVQILIVVLCSGKDKIPLKLAPYEMHDVGIPNKNKSLSQFLITAFYLNKTFDDFQYLLSCIKNNFDIVGVTEMRITKHLSLLKNFNLSY